MTVPPPVTLPIRVPISRLLVVALVDGRARRPQAAFQARAGSNLAISRDPPR